MASIQLNFIALFYIAAIVGYGWIITTRPWKRAPLEPAGHFSRPVKVQKFKQTEKAVSKPAAAPRQQRRPNK